MHEGITTSLVQ